MSLIGTEPGKRPRVRPGDRELGRRRRGSPVEVQVDAAVLVGDDHHHPRRVRQGGEMRMARPHCESDASDALVCGGRSQRQLELESTRR